MRKLLHPDPSKRLGGTEEDASEIKNHPFFKDVDWEAMLQKKVITPFKPYTRSVKDTSNIDKAFLVERPIDSPVHKHLTFSQQEKVYFDQFTYNRDDDDQFLLKADGEDEDAF